MTSAPLQPSTPGQSAGSASDRSASPDFPARASAPARPSLRKSLVITSTIACLTAFTLAGIILYFSMRDSLYRQFDDALVARATALAALVEQSGPQVQLKEDPSVMSGFSSGQRRNYFEVL